MRRFISIAIVAISCGCAVQGGVTGTLSEPQKRDDQFAPYQEVVTPTLRSGAIPNVTLLKLIGRRDRKSGEATALASVQVSYEARSQRHYEIARNSRAETLPLQVVSRGHSTTCRQHLCRYVEDYLVELPLAELRHTPGAAFAFKLFAKGGHDHLVAIPKELIASLIKSLDEIGPPPPPPRR